MNKIKFNYFFFIWAIVLPVGVITLAIPLFWPLIDNPYGNIILSPFWTIVGMYIWGFAFSWAIAAYMALPWLAGIREDGVTFHRLFRRKLEVNLQEVKEVEIISKKLPVESNPWGVGNVIFRKANGDYILVAGISNSSLKLIKDLAENNGIAVYEVNRQLTQEEKHKID